MRKEIKVPTDTLENGRKYPVLKSGEVIYVYPISEVAKALEEVGYPRSTQTIRKWGTSGITPETTLRKAGRRVYTREQILVLTEAVQEANIKRSYDLALTDFPEIVHRKWEERIK